MTATIHTSAITSNTRYTAIIHYQEEILKRLTGNTLERLVPAVLNFLEHESIGANGSIINNTTHEVECSYQKRCIEA